MTAHLVHQGEPSPVRRASKLFQLNWNDYWVLIGILGGMLALAAVLYALYHSS